MPSKMWTVMNDLDAVTSKICSAREILDCAIDRLQEHQYDKVEQLMYAVDEFLQYYLAEFDEKFKLAWQETVVKQKKIDDCMSPWGHSDMEAMKYTDEELDAMCDAAEKKTWVLPVEEDGDDCVVTFPDELMAKTGWKEGDVLEWIDNGDGSYTLKKVTETLEMDQC
jgi:hypothetical protein